MQVSRKFGNSLENLNDFILKYQLPDSLTIFLIWKPCRRTKKYLKHVKKKKFCIIIMLKLFIVCLKKNWIVLRIFQKGWTLVFDGSDRIQISEKFVNNQKVWRKSLKTMIKCFQNACSFSQQTFQSDWIFKKVFPKKIRHIFHGSDSF